MGNRDRVAGYEWPGEERVRQGDRPIHTFCAAVGTSGMLMGTSRVLLRKEPKPRIVAFEPATSSVLTGGKAGTHGVEGVAPGFVPPQLDRALVCGHAGSAKPRGGGSRGSSLDAKASSGGRAPDSTWPGHCRSPGRSAPGTPW